ncbi:MAG: hypothetical protein EXR72_07680 [Myxococcales bacterium]|nr:hypothetical protein [Myxococcales bacterium]
MELAVLPGLCRRIFAGHHPEEAHVVEFAPEQIDRLDEPGEPIARDGDRLADRRSGLLIDSRARDRGRAGGFAPVAGGGRRLILRDRRILRGAHLSLGRDRRGIGRWRGGLLGRLFGRTRRPSLFPRGGRLAQQVS